MDDPVSTREQLIQAPSARAGFGEWIRWFGVARLVTAAGATVIVCLGGFWLVRSPPPDVASAIPRAPTATTSVLVTLPTTPPPTTQPATVIVHVTGAVSRPGVYEFPAGERVRAAVEAAGGPTKNAVESALNLAAPLVDGSRIQVPRRGEDVVEVVQVPATDHTAEAGTPIDVNAASLVELEQLPGVGPATALAIVTERENNGPFVSVDDVDRVPGIGPSKLAALRDLITT